jgi:DNA-binding LacI/PurR family transcriptional regulator
MSDSPITIRQLAALAGVSPATVSLALQNHPRLSEATRSRVAELARVHGYRPDPVTASLMGRLRTARRDREPERIGYLTWWEEAEGWRKNSNDRNWFAGACERADALGYQIEHIWAREPGMTARRLSKVLYTRAIRGVIIAPFLRSRGHVSLDWDHFSAATISTAVTKPDLHRAAHFHFDGVIMALRTLRQHGYRRVGLANQLGQIERVRYGWLAGYQLHQQGLPKAEQVRPLVLQKWSYRDFVRWFEKYRPEAVISNNSEPLHYLTRYGLDVPGDVGFASLDVIEPDEGIAGIDQQHQLIASAAVDLVTAQLQRHETGIPACPKIVHLRGVWKQGRTVRKKDNAAGVASEKQK